MATAVLRRDPNAGGAVEGAYDTRHWNVGMRLFEMQQGGDLQVGYRCDLRRIGDLQCVLRARMRAHQEILIALAVLRCQRAGEAVVFLQQVRGVGFGQRGRIRRQ
jgi:hypothetical protein